MTKVSCCHLLTIFSKLTFSTKSFRNIIRVPNCLHPYQDQHSVGPDLGPNCLQRLSVIREVNPSKERANQLRNEFDFWNVHGIMNTSGLLQSGLQLHVNFARYPKYS